MSGKGNHQYGLRGDKNSSFKNYTSISYWGYELTLIPDHPFCNSDNKVFTHRLVAEKYLLTDANSIEINGKKYLKPELEVHHRDFDKLNNKPDNLIILTKSEHMKLHMKLRKQAKNKTDGRFIKTIGISLSGR